MVFSAAHQIASLEASPWGFTIVGKGQRGKGRAKGLGWLALLQWCRNHSSQAQKATQAPSQRYRQDDKIAVGHLGMHSCLASVSVWAMGATWKQTFTWLLIFQRRRWQLDCHGDLESNVNTNSYLWSPRAHGSFAINNSLFGGSNGTISILI